MAKIKTTTPAAIEARLLSAWLRLETPPLGGIASSEASARVVDLYRTLSDRQQLCCELSRHAFYLARCGDLPASERALEETERLHDTVWPAALRWEVLWGRANARWAQGRSDEMYALWKEGLQLATAHGDTDRRMVSLILLEQAASTLGRLNEAVERGRELVALTRRLRFVGTHGAAALHNLTCAYLQLGKVSEALGTASEALPQVMQTDLLPVFLDPLALLAFKMGQVHAAARILGRAEANYAASNARREPVESRTRDSLLSGLQQALSPAELARMLADGAVMSDEDAARLAFAS